MSQLRREMLVNPVICWSSLSFELNNDVKDSNVLQDSWPDYLIGLRLIPG